VVPFFEDSSTFLVSAGFATVAATEGFASVFGAVPFIVTRYPTGKLATISGLRFSKSSTVVLYCFAIEYFVSFGKTS